MTAVPCFINLICKTLFKKKFCFFFLFTTEPGKGHVGKYFQTTLVCSLAIVFWFYKGCILASKYGSLFYGTVGNPGLNAISAESGKLRLPQATGFSRMVVDSNVFSYGKGAQNCCQGTQNCCERTQNCCKGKQSYCERMQKCSLKIFSNVTLPKLQTNPFFAACQNDLSIKHIKHWFTPLGFYVKSTRF